MALGHVMLLADMGRPLTALLRLQHPDVLFVRKPCTLYSVQFIDTMDSTKIRRKFRGSGRTGCHAPSARPIVIRKLCAVMSL